MANQYLDTDYVDAFLGAGVRAALFTDRGTGSYSSAFFNTLAVAATSAVETALRNSGYTPPTATAGTASTVTAYVRMAAYGVFVEMASSRPENRLKLPEDWSNSEFKRAKEAVLSGDATLDLSPSSSTGVGGVTFSEQSDDVSSIDGSRPLTFSRKNMYRY